MTGRVTDLVGQVRATAGYELEVEWPDEPVEVLLQPIRHRLLVDAFHSRRLQALCWGSDDLSPCLRAPATLRRLSRAWRRSHLRLAASTETPRPCRSRP